MGDDEKTQQEPGTETTPGAGGVAADTPEPGAEGTEPETTENEE